jgi:cytochrome c6
MKNIVRSQVVLALGFALAGSVCFAQSGEATYKAKCQSCHGAAGVPNPGMAKMMGIKPANDPDMKKLTVDSIESTIKTGKGKMKPIAGLSDSDVKDVAAYYKSLGK